MCSNILEKLSHYDIISFDIFDTLIKRNVCSPEDVFVLVERKYNYTHDCKICDFKHKRIEAYKNAKNKKNVFDIDYIYNFIDFNENEKKALKELEILTELNICVGNKPIVDILKMLKSMNKKVFIISDMYLPKNIIKNILDKAGIFENFYDFLYISCDEGYEKNRGELFKFIKNKNEITNSKWIHVGDNWKSDIISAFFSGLSVYHLATQQNNLTYSDISSKSNIEINKSVMLATANNLMNYANNEFEKLGIETMGPLMLGFMTWLHKKLVENNIKKVFFLARDGKIMMEYFKILFPSSDINISYMYASRRSIIIPSYWTNCTYEGICNAMSYPLHMNIKDFFYRLNLDIQLYSDLLKKYNIDETYAFSGTNMLDNTTLRCIFNDVRQDVYDKSYHEYILLKDYLSQIDFFYEKSAIVDVGWNGGMQKSLEALPCIQDSDTKVYGYYLGINSKSLKTDLKFADGFIYNSKKNLNYRYYIYGFAGPLELTFFANHGTVINFKRDNDIIVPCLADNEYIIENKKAKELVAAEFIQKGARDFLNNIRDTLNWKLEDIDPIESFSSFFKFATNPKYKHLVLFEDYGAVDLNSNQIFIGSKYRHLFGEYSIMKGLGISTWKIGFMKYIFRIPFPYKKIYLYLRKRRG